MSNVFDENPVSTLTDSTVVAGAVFPLSVDPHWHQSDSLNRSE